MLMTDVPVDTSVGKFLTESACGSLRFFPMSVACRVSNKSPEKGDTKMLNDIFSNHGLVIFLSVFFLLVSSLFINFRRKPREEKPDGPLIFGPVRGMYVCYQCDTIFNTRQCPECGEEAVIPLIHLTGSITENERVASVISKMQTPGDWKMPAFRTFQDTQIVAPSSVPENANGDASKVPLTMEVLKPERSRELS